MAILRNSFKSIFITFFFILCAFVIEAKQSSDNVSPIKYSFRYDDKGRITKLTNPAGVATNIRYMEDEEGNLCEITRQLSDGKNISYEYNRFGCRVKMMDLFGTVHYEYDGYNNLVSVHREGYPALTYSYDTMNRICSMTIDTDFSVRYSYDFVGRLLKIMTPAGDVQYQYQTGQGRVIRSFPNGIRNVWQYKPDGLLETISHVLPDNHIILRFAYSYYPDGQISEINEYNPKGVKVYKYFYDKVGRLINVQEKGGSEWEYQYDELGNRISSLVNGEERAASNYDWAGRMEMHNGEPCGYDAIGNLTSYHDEFGFHQFEYDEENHLESADIGKVHVKYQYDGDGQLFSRKVGIEETYFVNDAFANAWRPLLIYDNQGNKSYYIWDGDIPLIKIENDAAEYYLTDHLGSIRSITLQNATVKQSLEYEAYGKHLSRYNMPSIDPGFSGLFYDPITCLYHTQARPYSPDLGCFTQFDQKINFPDGTQRNLSPFAYCGLDPVNSVDRTGCESEPVSTSEYLQISQNVIEDIQSKQLFCNRISVYIDEWIKVHGKGPVVLMVRGMQHRLDEGEAYAQETFNGKRVIVLPSYESVGIIGHKLTEPEGIIRAFFDLARTLIDRSKLTRNLDLPKIWQQLEDKGCPVILSIHESAANHDVAKNVKYIIQAKNNGAKIPQIVITSGNIGTHNVESLRESNITVYSSITHPNDIVGKLTKSPHDVAAEIPIIGELIGNIPIVDFIAGEVSKIRSIPGALFGGRVPLIPGWGYGLHEHAQHGSELNHIIDDISWKYHINIFTQPVVPAKWIKDIAEATRRNQEMVMQHHQMMRLEEQARRQMKDMQIHEQMRKFADDLRRYYPGGPGGPSGGGGAAISPSHVGGVYLKGAGEALSHMGQIKEVAFDKKNGRMILVSEGEQKRQLPSLRMDDIVTIFRNIYENGQAPFVTIDPDSTNPEGPFMLVKNDKGTDNTYVGWVLFESDRVMKGYSLGRDNVTHQPIQSKISGYKDLLDLHALYRNPADSTIWERFWIVPDHVDIQQTGGDHFILLDVPLKVMTQRMMLNDGKLVPATDPTPSEAASQFAEWFTRNYDKIAEENESQTPEGSGFKKRVKFYKDLKGMALIAALAERMRDQGSPLPSWMSDYPVAPCPVKDLTPALTIEKGNAHMYGGVELSTFNKEKSIIETDTRTDPLKEKIVDQIENLQTFSPVAFEVDKAKYRAVSIADDNFGDYNPCCISVTDIRVPVARGTELTLTRKYNSFFMPDGILGRAWTFDLPKLVEMRQPVEQTGNSIRIKTFYQLKSSLGTYSEVFKDIQYVPEVNGSLLVPVQSTEFFGIAHGSNEKIGYKTTILLFRDGRSWHFNSDGFLVAQIKEPLTIIYERDSGNNIQKIRASYGKHMNAEISFYYNEKGLLKSIHDGTREAVSYQYSDDNMLLCVVGGLEKTRYDYNENGFLAAINRNDQELRRFIYDQQGRIITEQSEDGMKIKYTIEKGDGKVDIKIKGNHPIKKVQYDSNFRLTHVLVNNGSELTYAYDVGGDLEARMILPEGEQYCLNIPADQKSAVLNTPAGGRYRGDFDATGRMIGIYRGDIQMLKQNWHPNGLAGSLLGESFSYHPEYSDDHIPTSFLITPPEEGPLFNQWARVQQDDLGRPLNIKDFTGFEVMVDYDSNGEIAEMESKRATIDVHRDEKERLTSVETSWGDQQYYSYDSEKEILMEQRFQRGDNIAIVEYDQERPTRIQQFNESEYQIGYYDQGKHKGLMEYIRTPDGLELYYHYDETNHMISVQCKNIFKIEYKYDKKGRMTEVVQSMAIQSKS